MFSSKCGWQHASTEKYKDICKKLFCGTVKIKRARGMDLLLQIFRFIAVKGDIIIMRTHDNNYAEVNARSNTCECIRCYLCEKQPVLQTAVYNDRIQTVFSILIYRLFYFSWCDHSFMCIQMTWKRECFSQWWLTVEINTGSKIKTVDLHPIHLSNCNLRRLCSSNCEM